MLEFLDSGKVDRNVAKEVLKSMKETIKSTKNTRKDELITEATIIKQLYDFFNVPQNLLKVNTGSAKFFDDSYTEYFAITLPDSSTLNAEDQVLSRIAKRVCYELSWNKHTFRGNKEPEKILLTKLKTIQKNENYLRKGKLAELCITLESKLDRIADLKEKSMGSFQNIKKLREELKLAVDILPKKVQIAEAYKLSIDNPDTLDSIKSYMEKALPRIEEEIQHLMRKITALNNGIEQITKSFQTLDDMLVKELNELKNLTTSKPISLWPKKGKKS
jgi:methyl-accepting chemotaxis protein